MEEDLTGGWVVHVARRLYRVRSTARDPSLSYHHAPLGDGSRLVGAYVWSKGLTG